MTFINENLTTQLKQCLTLAQSVETQREAQQKFEQLQQQMSYENPEGVALMELLGEDIMAAYDSVGFWQQMGEVDQEIASHRMETPTQMRQNYLRVMHQM